jgi:CubicO group peptidase (beta-lactamase class C family)
MKKIILIILCLGSIAYACKSNNPVNNNPTLQVDSAQIDNLVNTFMQNWDLPGGSFTMALNGNIVYSKGYGYADVTSQTPVTQNSLFRIASCTKPFTSVAVMQLIQNGQLNLNDIVFGPSGILNQAQYQTINDPRILNITIQNLLEHTSGWNSDSTGDPMFMSVQIANAMSTPPPAMQETIIEYTLANIPLTTPPGTYYAYSNFGYCVLGRVIEKVTGLIYDQYIRQNVLTPSGISDMQLGLNLEDKRYANEVTYYGTAGEMTTTSVYGTGAIVPWPYGGFNIEAMDSHGEWIASSTDLVKFLLAVGNNSLISQSTYNTMITPPNIPGDTYAKGWLVNSGTIFHDGSLPGTISEIVKATNGYSWALVFNKRSLNNNLFTDLDQLGWNIQQYIQANN